MPEINTTNRWTAHCTAKHWDGRKCKLYTPHDGVKHMGKNDLEEDRWSDDECS